MLSPASVKGHGLNKDNDEDGAVAWMEQRGDLQPVACGPVWSGPPSPLMNLMKTGQTVNTAAHILIAG